MSSSNLVRLEVTMENRVQTAINEIGDGIDGCVNFSSHGQNSFVYIIINPEMVRNKSQIEKLVADILSKIPDFDKENEFYLEPKFDSISGFYWSMQLSLWKDWRNKKSDTDPYDISGILRISILPDPCIPMANYYTCLMSLIWSEIKKFFNK
ncbi:MAG: hypothetical protein UZ19_OD1000998 [Parcubacteria bacterium OLB19]|nr:MAG: hypothetical protein UZ19_OD1000998 [Parcubacteria bacterium OLB19]